MRNERTVGRLFHPESEEEEGEEEVSALTESRRGEGKGFFLSPGLIPLSYHDACTASLPCRLTESRLRGDTDLLCIHKREKLCCDTTFRERR